MIYVCITIIYGIFPVLFVKGNLHEYRPGYVWTIMPSATE